MTVPPCRFTVKQRNGKDASGKPVKYLYSKRRTASVACLLAIQKANREKCSFYEAIGVEESRAREIGMREWEKICKQFLAVASRKMSENEVVELGEELYDSGGFNMLRDDRT